MDSRQKFKRLSQNVMNNAINAVCLFVFTGDQCKKIKSHTPQRLIGSD